jgi:hypothetical protein
LTSLGTPTFTFVLLPDTGRPRGDRSDNIHL